MNDKDAIEALSALSNALRLQAFRLLIGLGPEGAPAGEIAERLGVPPSTLSSHLAVLLRAGLFSARRDHRKIIYSVDIEGIRGLLSYLMEDCCQGMPEICDLPFEPCGSPHA